MLGVVDAAVRVHLNTTAATTGATVYDGDRFSTEAGGRLRVRSGAVVLGLARESVVSGRNQANGGQGLEAEPGKGTLIFSAERVASLNVIALEASICPVADENRCADNCYGSKRIAHPRSAESSTVFLSGRDGDGCHDTDN